MSVLLRDRSDEERERDGTAALTAGAVGRGAAVPLPYIGGALSRNVRNADELAYQIAATVASGLVQVSCGCLDFCFLLHLGAGIRHPPAHLHI